MAPAISQRVVIKKAEAHLRRVDPIMATLIRRHGPCALADYEYRPFHTLTAAIISQQLSSAAADTIENRIATLVPPPFEPVSFLSASQSALLKAGLSKAKLHYIRTLAERTLAGQISFAQLPKQTDPEIVATLCELPGIGPWTAEMFLIFGLQRLDILSLGDSGLHRAASLLYPRPRGQLSPLARISKRWRPYRTIASWYLWRFLDAKASKTNER